MRSRLVAVFVALLLFASIASAARVETVLAPDSTLYAVDAAKETAQLEISRRRGDVRETLLVPTTDDEAIESQARLAYDSSEETLYVMWHRAAEGVDEVLLASLNAGNEWSDVRVIASGSDVRRAALQLVLMHAREESDESDTTLIHAAWWSLSAEATVPEYALLAFENGRHLSSEIVDLHSMVEQVDALSVEEAGAPEHPPLTMGRRGNGVDVVFGEKNTTAVTRVHIQPKRISVEARIWRPSGRSTAQTGPTRLIPHGSSPVQVILGGDRIALYTPDAKFRFVVYDGEQWTPVRMIELDEKVTTDELLQELRQTLEENAPLETKPKSY
ncbi:MAG TPA: hypothetical protein VEK79_17615 [Thermoanaerobaculia bacterium]|nr:hypothetical protein [Thermoanaerobaculia bacterium]